MMPSSYVFSPDWVLIAMNLKLAAQLTSSSDGQVRSLAQFPDSEVPSKYDTPAVPVFTASHANVDDVGATLNTVP